jgi:catechol 2,3-dioxygenase-like lactoylglutathione lyase family enzyme
MARTTMRGMIAGAHTVIFAEDAERARAFLRDVLGFEGVDAGDGWLIFALPPGEIAVHPRLGMGPRARASRPVLHVSRHRAGRPLAAIAHRLLHR